MRNWTWRAWCWGVACLGAEALLASGCIESLPPEPQQPVMVRSFSGVLVPGDYVSPTAYEHYLLAELHSQHGRKEEAVDELRRALASDGASAYLRTRLCEELLTIGRIDEAREEVEAALTLDSSFADAHVDRARVLLRLGDRAGAEASLKRSIELDPTLPEAYVTLVALYRNQRGPRGAGLQLGDVIKVESTWRAMVRALPQSARAHQALGHLLLERAPDGKRGTSGSEDEARRELSRALELDPTLIDPRLDLAQLARLDGNPEEAARLYGDVYDANHDLTAAEAETVMLMQAGQKEPAAQFCQQLEDEGGDAHRLVAVGRLWLLAGRADRAALMAEQALTKGELAAARLLAAEAATQLGKSDDALTQLLKIPANAVEYTAATQRAAALLCNDGKFAAARDLLAKAMRGARYDHFNDQSAGLPPRYSIYDDLQLIAGDVELRAGEPQRAVALLQKALDARPGSSILPLGMARALLAAGQRERAVEVARNLVRRDDQQLDALLFLAQLEVERGKLDEAGRLFDRARLLAPRSPQVADALGRWAVHRGKLDEAEALLTRAERLSPDDPRIVAHLAELEAQRSKREAALVLYRRALQLRPAEPLLHEVEQAVGRLESDRMGSR